MKGGVKSASENSVCGCDAAQGVKVEVQVITVDGSFMYSITFRENKTYNNVYNPVWYIKYKTPNYT